MSDSSAACGACSAALPDAALACPQCQRLVHRELLNALSTSAQRATETGDRSAALAAWRSALDLLPARSKQHAQVAAKIDTLSRALDAGAPDPAATTPKEKGKVAAGATGLALLVWKFKFAIAFVLTKGKLLLLGFTKLGTVLSMAISVGVYAMAFGWKYAALLVLSLYVHEMGHVAALRKFGIAASAPMFIPGLGAFVRLKQYPANPVEDARVGLAGPIWGLGAALAFGALAWVTDVPLLFAIAKTGAWINLFNLVPVWQLDGGRAFRALTRRQRWLAVAGIAVAWLCSGQSIMVLLLLGAAFRAFEKNAPAEGDRRTLITYVALAGLLAALCTIVVTV